MTCLFDLLHCRFIKQMHDVSRLAGCTDCGDKFYFFYFLSQIENRRAAEAMANQNIWSHTFLPHRVDGGSQIIDVGREIRVGELAFAFSKTSEVETQHGEATFSQTS